MKQLTNEDYLEKGICPYCGYGRIEQKGHLEMHDGVDIIQKMTCRKCGEDWFDKYKLIGYELK